MPLISFHIYPISKVGLTTIQNMVLICKIIIHGETRQEAIKRLERALSELIIDGI